MRIALCIVVALTGCFTSTTVKPPEEPTERPVEVDDRPAPDRTYRRVEPARASCDDATSFDCLMSTFGDFRDRACACSPGDKVCADAVVADMTTWSQNLAAQFSKTAMTPTPEQTKQMSDVTTDFTKCLSAAMTPTSITPTP